MRVPPVVASAEEWPEVPGARIIVQREGGRLPRGFWRIMSRVIRPEFCYPNVRHRVGVRAARTTYVFTADMELPRSASGMRYVLEPGAIDLYMALDILLVAPKAGQAWWERAHDRGLITAWWLVQ